MTSCTPPSPTLRKLRRCRPATISLARKAGLTALLEGAGLLDVGCDMVSWHHRVDREQWWSGPANGIASIGYIVSRLDQPTVQRMKDASHQLSARYLDEPGILALPTSALVGVGTRPVE